MVKWIAFMLLAILLNGCREPSSDTQAFRVAEALGGTEDSGFARAIEPRDFVFPQDHAPHPEYRNEWWYLTGNLRSEDGREFGYQATLFRIALQARPSDSTSAWRSNQIWMGHAALTDLQQQQHFAYERLARQGAGLAGASIDPLSVWLEDWRLQLAEQDGHWSLQFPTETYELQLEMSPQSPVVLQGNQGLSQKSSAPGNASYYYSIPRLATSGTLRYQDRLFEVNGLSWLDREWSTSALGPDQQGWDWFSLHLDDGRNLMYYQLRRKDGSVDPFSAGSLSDAQGLRQQLRPGMISLTPTSYWESSARRYPIEWRMELAGEPQAWRITARLADQEMRLSVNYWEGAVEIREVDTGKAIGTGYLEMAGYE